MTNTMTRKVDEFFFHVGEQEYLLTSERVEDFAFECRDAQGNEVEPRMLPQFKVAVFRVDDLDPVVSGTVLDPHEWATDLALWTDLDYDGLPAEHQAEVIDEIKLSFF